MSSPLLSLTLSPIGVIHTAKRVKFDTPHQPAGGVAERNTVEIFPDKKLQLGLSDLVGFERIWLIWWFHKNANWRPMVIPPRGPEVRRGVFATRSPHRPNPIGMTAVPLIAVSGRFLTVGDVDLLDGTPILDIKPYISTVDSFPNQRDGWLHEVEEAYARPPSFQVICEPLAQEQYDWLSKEWGVSFMEKVFAILAREPFRSRANRITSSKNGVSRLSSGVWRVFFRVTSDVVSVIRIAPGYPRRVLFDEGFEIVSEWMAQRGFYEKWEDG